MGKWHLIQNQQRLREIFKEPPFISYRKGKSLKDLLVRAKLWRSYYFQHDLVQESCDARRLFLTISFLDLYLDKNNIRCSRTTLKRDKIDIVAAHIARSLVNGADMVNDEEDDVEDEESDDEYENDVVLEEIGEENDQEEATDTGEKSDTDQDYDESDNESDVGNDYEDDEDSEKDDHDDHDVGDNEGLQISDILCTTKSGRTCGTWKARYLFYWLKFDVQKET